MVTSRLPTSCVVTLLLPALVSGCFQYKDVNKDRNQHPVVMTGASATILYPGQNPASLPPLPPGAAPPGQSGRTASAGSAAGPTPTGHAPNAAPTGGTVLLGGSENIIRQHRHEHREPRWYNPFWFPFAVILFPFRAARKVVDYLKRDRQPEATPANPSSATAPNLPSADREALQAAHERAQLEALERQLAGQRAASGALGAPPTTTAPNANGPTIAQELASLKGVTPATSTTGAGGHSRSSPSLHGSALSAPGVADRVEDRDGDGRPDHWTYRRDGRLVSDQFDDDADGAPDRLVWYDDERGEPARVEEDANHDGALDTWTFYDHGELVRRRTDRDGDGSVDAWTFYREGRVVRHEEDTNGDGFRDRVDFYTDGELERREEDSNGDGLPDRITRFDRSGAPLSIDEDQDGDGRVDVRSHYVQGRLSRRELLSELSARQALDPPPAPAGRRDATESVPSVSSP